LEWAAGNAGGGGYASHERLAQWHRARSHVGTRAREMPPPPDVLPGAASPLPPAPVRGAVDGMPTIIEPGWNGAASNGVNGASPATVTTPAPETTGTVFGPPPVVPPPPAGVDYVTWARAWETVRYREVLRAAERYGMPAPRALVDDLITGTGLDDIADPVPLVDGWLFADSLARLNGRPGGGKTFVAVDLACSVATGTQWHGQDVAQGLVLLLIAEGVSGIRKRVRAWENAHGVKVADNLIVLPYAVQVTDDDRWTQFVEVAHERRPALVVLDTQSRISVDLNENGPELGRFVGAVERLREACAACVLVVHHKSKSDGEGGRGHNVVEGAMTSEYDVWKKGDTITVKNTKQKDIESGYVVDFTLKPELNSMVLTRNMIVVEPGNSGVGTTDSRMRWLWSFIQREFNHGEGGSRDDIRAGFRDHFFPGKSTSTARDAWRAAWQGLISKGLVARHLKAERFKVIVREDQSADGVLSPNYDGKGVAPESFIPWTFAQEEADKSS
jgi:hypothetical protein